jgi:V/A-type H+-transporting ATPase subunit C
MSSSKRLDYAFAVGRVRALEVHLIARAVFEEAAEGRSLAAAMKILMDAGKFREERVEFQNSQDLDGYLDGERAAVLADVAALFSEDVYMRIIRERHRPRDLWHSARDLEHPFVRDYVRHLLDLSNLKLFLRARYLELPVGKWEPALLAGGFMEAQRFSLYHDLPFTEVGELLHATPYREVWDRAVDTLLEKDSFSDLERGIEDFMMRHLRRARRIVFGPEPVFAFALARLKELELVRLIGVGKLLQIPADVLHSRISETYV